MSYEPTLLIKAEDLRCNLSLITDYPQEFCVEENKKSFNISVGMSSGKKRSDLKIFQEKGNKYASSISPLIWAKDEVLSFCQEFKDLKSGGKKCIVHIGWADNRRRNIYTRLKKYGFYFGSYKGSKCLVKLI